MSAGLLKLAIQYLDAQLKADRVKVAIYGGELNAQEINASAVACPGVLVTCLGWVPPPPGADMAGSKARCAQMAAFVVANNTQRTERMTAAMTLAERVERLLKAWSPQDNEFFDVAAPELPSLRAENLYSHRVDKVGLALWLVGWRQCASDKLLSAEQDARLVDWLAVDISSTATAAGPDEPAAGEGPAVTHELDFKPS